MWSRLFSLSQVSSWFSFTEEAEVARLAVTFKKNFSEDSDSGIEEDIVSAMAFTLDTSINITLAHSGGLLARRWNTSSQWDPYRIFHYGGKAHK